MEDNKKAVIQVYEVETKDGGALESYIDEGLSDKEVACACALVLSQVTRGMRMEDTIEILSDVMKFMLEYYLRGN